MQEDGFVYLFSDGIHMGTQLSQSNIPVLVHHAGPIQMPQTLVRIGLKMVSVALVLQYK